VYLSHSYNFKMFYFKCTDFSTVFVYVVNVSLKLQFYNKELGTIRNVMKNVE
jgi:hypothetical protein